MPGVLNLSDINGFNGFTITGRTIVRFIDGPVAIAGDFNGDGFDDILIGEFEDLEDIEIGRAFLVFGRGGDFFPNLNLTDLDGNNGFALNGIVEGGRAGFAVSGAGDINGDGFVDIVVGAPGVDTNGNQYGTAAGQVYVVFGGNQNFTPEFELSGLDGETGFIRSGINAGDVAGASVAGVGDINGDGLDDFAVSGGGRRGEAYVVFGSTEPFAADEDFSDLRGSTGFVLTDIPGSFGVFVSSAGDINGDGVDDFMVGAPGLPGVYVIFGSRNGLPSRLDVSDLDGSNGFSLVGLDGFDNTGASLSSIGDFNGDGVDDIVISASGSEASGDFTGQAYIVFGSRNGFAESIDLADLNGQNGFTINGIAEGDTLARSVSGAGDLNGDGFADVIISADGADPNGIYSAGQSYVILGTDTRFQRTFDLNSLDGFNGFVINGADELDLAGESVAGGGDINGDGFDDLLVYTSDFTGEGSQHFGVTYVIFGAANIGRQGDRETGTAASERFIGSAGDDTLDGGAGNDFLRGDAGDDRVIGGIGDDTIFAGPGDEGNDILEGSAGDDLLGGGAGDDLVVGDEVTVAAQQTSSVTYSDTLFGGAGNDTLIGGGWRDANDNGRFDEGEQNLASNSSNTAYAGTGDDLIFGAAGADILGGGAGNDTLTGGSGNDIFYGGKGATDNDDVFMAGSGADTVFGGSGADTLSGEAGDDQLFGGGDNDTLDGGAGADSLFGGAGDDTITGGTGADAFFFGGNHGDDVVRDFDVAADVLFLGNAVTDFTDLASVRDAATETTQSGQSGLLIDTGGGNSIFLIGVTETSLITDNISL